MNRWKKTALTTLPALLVAALAAGQIVNTAGATPAPGATPVTDQRTLLVQLAVTDLDRSIAFYRDVLGLEIESVNEGLKWARVKTGIPNVTIGLGENPEAKGSGTVSLNLGVGDIERARATLESRGVKFLGPTLEIPGVVKLADLMDPDGNKIRLAGHS